MHYHGGSECLSWPAESICGMFKYCQTALKYMGICCLEEIV